MRLNLANLRFTDMAADLQLRHRTLGTQLQQIVPDVDASVPFLFLYNNEPNLSAVFCNLNLEKNELTEKAVKQAVSGLKSVFLAKGTPTRHIRSQTV